jgi:hypothetical protein
VVFAGPLPPRRGAKQGKRRPMTVRRHPFPPKLSIEQAETIRQRYGAGEAPGRLAGEYGIAPSSVYAVVHDRAHRRRVVVTLSSEDFHQLERRAVTQQSSREDVARELIRRALGATP